MKQQQKQQHHHRLHQQQQNKNNNNNKYISATTDQILTKLEIITITTESTKTKTTTHSTTQSIIWCRVRVRTSSWSRPSEQVLLTWQYIVIFKESKTISPQSGHPHKFLDIFVVVAGTVHYLCHAYFLFLMFTNCEQVITRHRQDIKKEQFMNKI